MSNKKNYSKMYSAEEEQAVAEVPAEAKDDAPIAAPEEKPTVKKKKPKTVKGTVVNCAKLNVREQMNIGATVLCVLSASSEVKVIADEVHDEWYHVFTEDGVEGFCMKKYVAIKR